ncbi:MAG: sulfotransferase family protein [Solirubrobacterales bacterium]
MNSPPAAIRPLFLLSLPRSGSTLVQRVLATNPAIATASETWLLMPFLSAAPAEETLPSRGAWDLTAAQAIHDFTHELPLGKDSYLAAVRKFALDMYSQAAGGGAVYFLDKTPAYAHFLPDLIRIFPEAKFVVLWRNPLAVAASIVETFCDGSWEPDRYPLSLYAAPAALTEAAEQYAGRVWPVRYEDLVSAECDAWQGLMDYLELDFEPASLETFGRTALAGRLGDKSGTARYSALSPEPLTKWTQTIRTPLRKAWCRRYLDWIGPDRLSVMGYKHAELQADLDATPVGFGGLANDSVRVAESFARRLWRASNSDVRRPIRRAGPRRVTPTFDLKSE